MSKSITKKTGAEILEAEKLSLELEKQDRVAAFVKTKLSRLEAIEKNIKNFEDEKEKINEALKKIEAEDYSEVLNYPDWQLSPSVISLSGGGTGIGSWNSRAGTITTSNNLANGSCSTTAFVTNLRSD